MYIEDGSYSEDIKAEIMLDSYTKNQQFFLRVQIENKSKLVDVTTETSTITVTPFITAFAFNLPDKISVENLYVTDSEGNDISGWSIPYVGMRTTIPSPDNHGFWDAGASIGKLFTSGSPENGIAPDTSYYFNFLLSGMLGNPDFILDEAPSFGPSAGGGGSGGGGGGGGGGRPGYGKGKNAPQSAETDGETTEGGIPSLDWEEYFLVNMKGMPEGTIDFGLLVPESVLTSSELLTAQRSLTPLQAVATPEPSTLALMAVGALCAAFVQRRRTRPSI